MFSLYYFLVSQTTVISILGSIPVEERIEFVDKVGSYTSIRDTKKSYNDFSR